MKLFIDEINEVVKNAFEELGYERETGRVNVSNRPVSYTHLTLPTICSV